jgi:molybdate-binding protein/DNA-binding XRE family transcriptional regulator
LNWSQAELAKRAGISRAAVSAIEIHRLVPSVAAAISLATAIGCSVEELFGTGASARGDAVWAWPPERIPCRYWQARVSGRSLLYPVQATSGLAHDGVWQGGSTPSVEVDAAPQTLVMACCDPAAGLLATEFAQSTGFRLLVLPRSSLKALALLQEGLVHVAGVHLATEDNPDGNAHAVKSTLGDRFTLVRVAKWQEGLAVSPHARVRSVRDALRARLRWVGREPGSGARQCLDELLGQRPRPRRLAFDHRGVAEAVRSDWADVGVCLRLVSEEAGLDFFGVQQESYDLCFPTQNKADPRLQALLRVIRSSVYRTLLSELPGYDPTGIGESQRVR